MIERYRSGGRVHGIRIGGCSLLISKQMETGERAPVISALASLIAVYRARGGGGMSQAAR